MTVYQWAVLFVLILNMVYYATHLRSDGRINRMADLMGCVCVGLIMWTIGLLE